MSKDERKYISKEKVDYILTNAMLSSKYMSEEYLKLETIKHKVDKIPTLTKEDGLRKKETKLSYFEEKIQEKLDKMVASYEKEQKYASTMPGCYENCTAIEEKIEHFVQFCKEFFDVEIDFWIEPTNHYGKGHIKTCKVLSEAERNTDEYDR